MKAAKTIGTLLVMLMLQVWSSAQTKVTSFQSNDPLTATAAKLLRSHITKSGAIKTPGHGLNLYSAKDEQQMGDELESEVVENAEVVDDPMLVEYLTGVVTRLSVTDDVRRRKFVLKVVKDDGVNAMSLPNGTIFVNTGLLMFVQNESELAGVLAHEMAHVVARHATRNATRRGLWGAATLAVSMFGGGAGQALEPAAHMTSQVFAARFSRENELEADLYGLQYLHRAGYDPAEFTSLLKRIADQEATHRGKLKAILASHPPTIERLSTAKFVIDSFEKRQEGIVDTSSFIEARAHVLNLVYGESKNASDKPILAIKKKLEVENDSEPTR